MCRSAPSPLTPTTYDMPVPNSPAVRLICTPREAQHHLSWLLLHDVYLQPSDLHAAGYSHLIDDYEHMQRPTPAPPPTDPCPPHLAGQLIVSRAPLNPHLDRVPTTTCGVSILSLEYLRGQRRTLSRSTVVAVYPPSGTCAGTLSQSRLDHLHSLHARLDPTLEPVPFHTWLVAVMHAYPNVGKEQSPLRGIQLLPDMEWTLPPLLTSTIARAFGSACELFSSPVTFDPDVSRFLSSKAGDSVLGASGLPYNLPWRGSSIGCPSYTHDDLRRCVYWALMSAAHSSQASLTCLLLPDWPGSAFNVLIRDNAALAHVVLRIPKARMYVTCRGTWSGRQAQLVTGKWGVNLVVVANAGGKAMLGSLDVARLCRGVSSALWTSPAARLVYSDGVPGTVEASALFREWQRLQPQPSDTSLPRTSKYRAAARRARAAGSVLPGPPRGQLPYPGDLTLETTLRHNWRDLVYTDGSCQMRPGATTQSLGSAVYAPPQAPPPGHQPPQGVSYSYASDGVGPTNTINRAELVAIWQALLHPGVTHIATDSAVSLATIDRFAKDPASMRNHKHRMLIDAICREVARRPSGSPVHLLKVISHAGVVGNELADVAAGEAAAGRPNCCAVRDHADAWRDVYWPYACPPPHTGPPRPHLPCPVDGLGKALKAWMSQLHDLGTSDPASYYHCQWQVVLASVDGALSNGSLHNGSLPRVVQKRVLQYRTGTLYTNTYQHKLQPSASGACTLCGAADTAHHSVSACPRLSDAAASRHNAAGRILLRAIRKGTLGAYVVSADVGTLASPVDRPLPRRVPPSLCNGGPAPTVPDIVLHVPPTPARGPRPAGASRVLCIEIKYCCDYRTSHQMAAATSQHTPTLTLLRQAGHVPVLVPILLGVSGTVYTDMLDALHDSLGVPKAQARATCSLLHAHAAHTLSSIYGIKRKLESLARGGDLHTPRPPPTAPT